MPRPVALPNVLIIDDDVAVLRGLERLLRPRFQVTLVPSPSLALDAIGTGGAFDLILCDCRMPEMSGEEFRRRLYRVNRAQAGRVAFMTGGADPPEEPHLQKPFDLEEVGCLFEWVVSNAA